MINNSELISYRDQKYYVNSESLADTSIEKIFLFDDMYLNFASIDISGMPKIAYKKEIDANIDEGFGGAGYSVYGGGGGNPTGRGGKVYGRGFGFGQGSSNIGSSNTMYTYSIKPLDTILQQPVNTQSCKRNMHIGSEINGKILGKDKEINGKIIGIKKDIKGNIFHYIVQEFDTASLFNIDPTSVELVSHEDTPNMAGRDFVASIGENYFPSINSFLNEKSYKTKNPKTY